MSLSKAGKLPLYIPNPVQRVAWDKWGPIEELALHEGESTLTQSPVSWNHTCEHCTAYTLPVFRPLRFFAEWTQGNWVNWEHSTWPVFPVTKASAKQPDSPAAPRPVILLYFALITSITYGSLHPYACTYHWLKWSRLLVIIFTRYTFITSINIILILAYSTYISLLCCGLRL